jgi:septum formation protein
MDKKIVLASKSPRRYELMKMAGLNFEVITKDVEEIHPTGVAPEDVPLHLAKLKAEALKEHLATHDVIIGADTVVILNGRIYEKPKDREDAIAMLQQLSGKIHKVVTGVCMLTKDAEVLFNETTRVHFNELNKAEIEYYVDNYQPYDKAGSYACQEWIGAIAIARFEGDYFNVVGLPINRVYKELKQL